MSSFRVYNCWKKYIINEIIPEKLAVFEYIPENGISILRYT